MLEYLKQLATIIVKKIITGYEHLRVALGYATKTTDDDGVESFVIDGQEYPLSDEDTLDQVAVEITATTYKVCLVTFLLVCSAFLVNEFFFLILLIIEIGAVYFLLKYLYEAFFKISDERYN